MSDFEAWIKERGIGEVECLVPDMNGIIRGKVLPAQKFLQTVRDGTLRIPSSIYILTVTGEYPENEQELTAILDPDVVLRPDFDVTPETTAIPGDSSGEPVPVGTVLDWNRVPAGELAVPRASLNRHVFVCGATGAGKSQTVRGLLEAATRAGIPWLVVEPAKAEYRLMAARLAGASPAVIPTASESNRVKPRTVASIDTVSKACVAKVERTRMASPFSPQ